MSELYDAGGVPYTIVTVRPITHNPMLFRPSDNCSPLRISQTQKGEQMPILDRQGFLHSLIASARVDPQKFLQKLNKSISTFNLVDPATNQPFPGIIPAGAVPMMCDWAAASGLQQWQMSVGMQYGRYSVQKQQKLAGRKHMLGSAFSLLSGGTGLGGGSTGFGF